MLIDRVTLQVKTSRQLEIGGATVCRPEPRAYDFHQLLSDNQDIFFKYSAKISLGSCYLRFQDT